MAVVIRLRGLPVVAGSGDIRHFFSGLHIPDGGVHIIGGKFGEAFIIFATDEDARRAMSRSSGVIKNAQIELFLSSKTEMQNTLENSRKNNKDTKHPTLPPAGVMHKLESAVKKGMNQNSFENHNYRPGPDISGPKHGENYMAKYDRKEVKTFKESEDVYVFMYGLPYSVTNEEIVHFFDGLHVVDLIFLLRSNGLRDGNALVKFGSAKDADAALGRNKEYIGHRFINLKKASEQQWVTAGGQVEETHVKHPRKPRTRSRSPQNKQFYIHLKNLSYGVEKCDVKNFFGILEMADSQIKFLLDKHNNRTREGFVMLRSERQYEKCLALHKSSLTGRPVFIFPIPRKAMLELIESYERQTPPKRERSVEDYPRKSRSDLKRCIYLRNFPFDVSKAEVQKFFTGYPVHEDNIFLLFDSKGVGLGEALVRFPSEHQAMLAESLNRQPFLGTEVFLRIITDEQMKEFSAFIDAPIESILAHSPSYRDEYLEPNQHEPYDRSLAVPDDLAYGHGNFRGSPERMRGPYQMEFGPDESFGRFDMGNEPNVDYHHSLPVHQSFEGSSGGALIRIKNLPYTATLAEIFDFFYGYNIIPDSIDIKFNKKGMATGLATVCMESYDEAMAAVNELNERPIGTRKVSLTVSRL